MVILLIGWPQDCKTGKEFKGKNCKTVNHHQQQRQQQQQQQHKTKHTHKQTKPTNHACDSTTAYQKNTESQSFSNGWNGNEIITCLSHILKAGLGNGSFWQPRRYQGPTKGEKERHLQIIQKCLERKANEYVSSQEGISLFFQPAFVAVLSRIH